MSVTLEVKPRHHRRADRTPAVSTAGHRQVENGCVMDFKVKTAQEIAIRMAVWCTLMSISTLCTQDVRDLFPFNQWRHFYAVALEVVSILILLRLPALAIKRDMIDISLYTLLYKCVLLETYFVNAPLYLWLVGYLEAPLMGGLLMLTFCRLLSIRLYPQHVVDYPWPAFGPYGWTTQQTNLQVPKDNCIWAIFFVIFSAEIGLLFAGSNSSWFRILTGGTGLLFVTMYSNKLQNFVKRSIANEDDLNKLIAEYERTIEEATTALVALRAGKGDAVDRKIRLVATRKNVNDREP
jgi:hypothetical protein